MKFIRNATLTGLLFMALSSANAQAPPQPREFEMKQGDTTYVMKQYIMVLLKRGKKSNKFSEAELAKLQEGHMANIGRLAEMGKIVVAGPFGDDTDLRGIFIMDCATIEEAKALVDTDPSVAAGRLTAEYHPWWAAKGTVLK